MKRNLVRPLHASIAGLAAAAVLSPEFAHAYVGPGAGLTAIGTVLALFAAVGLAMVGFVWYPLKRVLRRTPAEARPRHEPRQEERRPE